MNHNAASEQKSIINWMEVGLDVGSNAIRADRQAKCLVRRMQQN